MTGKGRKEPAKRALRFSLDKNLDESPITSVKKPVKGGRLAKALKAGGKPATPASPAPPPTEMKVSPTKLHAAESKKGAKRKAGSQAGPDTPESPDKRLGDRIKKHAPSRAESAAAAKKASPPRPPPDLPPEIPPPPIPQGEPREATPDLGHLPEGAKGKNAILTSIFSPVYHFFQKDSQSDSLPPSDKKLRSGASRSRSRSPMAVKHSPPSDVEHRLSQPKDTAEQDSQRQKSETPDMSCREAPGQLHDVTMESSDGEDETCLTARPAHVQSPRVGREDSEGESEAGEGVEGESEEEDDDLEFGFDSYFFIKCLPPLKACVPSWRRKLLPKQTKKRKTLVLDMDETLVHSMLNQTEPSPDFLFEMNIGGNIQSVSVWKRPHVLEFLQRCAALYEVVVFTASLKDYADQVLDELDPHRKLISHRCFRESCVVVKGNHMKDLSVLGRDLSQTIIIDNSPQAFGFQLSNGIPIESWFDDEEDTELLKLLPFLESLVSVPDVRPLIENAFQLHKLVEQATWTEDC